MTALKTPTTVAEFNKEWLQYILEDWHNKSSTNQSSIDIISFEASKNGLQVKFNFWLGLLNIIRLQGQLSTTFLVDVKYVLDKSEQADKSLFVKVPLSGPAAVAFKSVNVREHSMLGQVLPELQTFIENHCTGKVDNLHN